MFQIRILKKYNMEIFYNNDYKNFKKIGNGKYYVRTYEELNEETINQIKKTYKNPVFCLFISEKGGLGKEKDDTYARVVCDYEGGKILPLYKIKTGYTANLEHAFFIGYDLCTVEVYWENSNTRYRITHYTIDKHTGDFVTEVLFEGKVKNRIAMPRKLKRFNEALDAACKKAADYQCTRIYYSL